MSEEQEQNDSPAFRLRPRRAAPKSYYTVRLEYSANPSAFIRERPRTNTKRKVFTSKTGSQRMSTTTLNNNQLQNVISREEKELEARRMSLLREISESITDSKLISPFMQRLRLEELKPDSVYEHNYITLRIKRIGRSTNGQLAHCLCESTDEYDDHDINNQGLPVKRTISVRLHNEYAESPLLKLEKLISIAKFKTSPLMPWQNSESDHVDETISSSTSRTTTPTSLNFNDNNDKINHYNDNNDNKCGPSTNITTTTNNNNTTIKKEINNDDNERLPFMVIVKYDELNKNVNNSKSDTFAATSSYRLDRGGGGGGVGGVSDAGHSSSSSNSSVTITLRRNTRRPLIPFISITDMIEKPVEPFVEAGPSSPVHISFTTNDDMNLTKKIKFTANTSQQPQQQQQQQQPQPQNQQQQQQQQQCSLLLKNNIKRS